MKNLSLREHYEEMTGKGEPTLISTERIVKRLCKSNTHRPPGAITIHRKEVFSDGWTRWVCSECGQVKFTKGMTFEEEK